MKTLMISPFPRWFLLLSKLMAGVAVSIVQVYMFMAIALFWGMSRRRRSVISKCCRR